MQKTLTSGSPWRVIVLFSIPLLLGNIVQQLYQVADAIVVGRILSVDSLAAVGTTGSIVFLVIGFAWGMTSGFAIPTAQAYGARDMEALRRSVAIGAILSAAVSVFLTFVGMTYCRQMLELLQTPPSLLEEATVFAQVSFAGTAAIVFFNFLSAVIRAIGDSKTPLIFLAISCLLNIALVFVLVRYTSLGVGGAALATILSQAISVVLCLLYVMRSVPILHVRRTDWSDSFRDAGTHLKLGLPMGFQSSIIAIGALAVQVRLNLLGPQAVAAYTTATRVDGLAVAFLASLGLAVTTYVAQNFGARSFDRVRQGARQAYMAGTVVAVIMAVILIAAGSPIVRVFVGDGEEAVVSMAHEYLVVNGILYVVLSTLFVAKGALQGIGRVLIPTVAGFMELALRVVAAIELGGQFGFSGVVWANPLAWIAAGGVLVVAWMSAGKNLGAQTKEQEIRDEQEPCVLDAA